MKIVIQNLDQVKRKNKRMWAHKIGKLQEPPTRNISRLNVQCPCIGKIKGADDSTFSYQSLEANMDDLYLIKNFGPFLHVHIAKCNIGISYFDKKLNEHDIEHMCKTIIRAFNACLFKYRYKLRFV